MRFFDFKDFLPSLAFLTYSFLKMVILKQDIILHLHHHAYGVSQSDLDQSQPTKLQGVQMIWKLLYLYLAIAVLTYLLILMVFQKMMRQLMLMYLLIDLHLLKPIDLLMCLLTQKLMCLLIDLHLLKPIDLLMCLPIGWHLLKPIDLHLSMLTD